MGVRPTQQQIDKASIIMEMINEAETQYLSSVKLGFNYFDDEIDKRIVTTLVNKNKKGLTISISNMNIVEWY